MEAYSIRKNLHEKYQHWNLHEPTSTANTTALSTAALSITALSTRVGLLALPLLHLCHVTLVQRGQLPADAIELEDFFFILADCLPESLLVSVLRSLIQRPKVTCFYSNTHSFNASPHLVSAWPLFRWICAVPWFNGICYRLCACHGWFIYAKKKEISKSGHSGVLTRYICFAFDSVGNDNCLRISDIWT